MGAICMHRCCKNDDTTNITPIDRRPNEELSQSGVKLNIVIVGPTNAGKTSMILVYKNNVFSTEYVANVMDRYEGKTEYSGI